jgi:hypothetical protein
MRSLLQSEDAAEPSSGKIGSSSGEIGSSLDFISAHQDVISAHEDIISAHQDVISSHQWDSSVLVSTVSSTPWLWRQLGLVILLSLSMLVRVTCMELCYFYSARAANNFRSMLLLGVFRSTVANRARAEKSAVPSATWQGTRVVGAAEEGAELGATTSTGKLTNLMATDADLIGRIAWFVWVLACWSWSLASLPLVLFMMWKLVGSAAAVGIGCLIVSNFASAGLARAMTPVQRRLQVLMTRDCVPDDA